MTGCTDNMMNWFQEYFNGKNISTSRIHDVAWYSCFDENHCSINMKKKKRFEKNERRINDIKKSTVVKTIRASFSRRKCLWVFFYWQSAKKGCFIVWLDFCNVSDSGKMRVFMTAYKRGAGAMQRSLQQGYLTGLHKNHQQSLPAKQDPTWLHISRSLTSGLVKLWNKKIKYNKPSIAIVCTRCRVENKGTVKRNGRWWKTPTLKSHL